jgi:hypothetical protein
MFGFRKMLERSLVAAQLAVSQEGLSFMKLVSWKLEYMLLNGRLVEK